MNSECRHCSKEDDKKSILSIDSLVSIVLFFFLLGASENESEEEEEEENAFTYRYSSTSNVLSRA